MGLLLACVHYVDEMLNLSMSRTRSRDREGGWYKSECRGIFADKYLK